jgi:hypothetical protein
MLQKYVASILKRLCCISSRHFFPFPPRLFNPIAISHLLWTYRFYLGLTSVLVASRAASAHPHTRLPELESEATWSCRHDRHRTDARSDVLWTQCPGIALITVSASDGGVGLFVILRLESVSNLGRMVDIPIYDQWPPTTHSPYAELPSTRWNDNLFRSLSSTSSTPVVVATTLFRLDTSGPMAPAPDALRDMLPRNAASLHSIAMRFELCHLPITPSSRPRPPDLDAQDPKALHH